MRGRGGLTAGWIGCALLLLLPGWLLVGLAETAPPRAAGALLLALVGLSLVNAVRRSLRTSLVSSALVGAGGITTVAVLAADGSVSTGGAVLFGGLPLAGAGTTAALAARRLRAARR